MKLKNIFLGVFLAALALSGCDVITNPLVQKTKNSKLPSTVPAFIDSSATSGKYSYQNYKVLVEDCMGHTCSNCPPAVYAGDALIAPASSVAGQVVLMEENMGGFADTVTYAQYPDSAFRKDYRSEAGNNWLVEFAVGSYPWGMINRMGFPATDVLFPNWLDSVNANINRNHSAIATIQIHDSVWTSPRIIGADFEVTFKQTLTGTYLLETAIIEDSINDWQLDGATIYGADSVFWHRNVLRGSFDYTGIGTTISATTAGSTWSTFQTYDFTTGENGKAAKWNMAHCYLVAFVYNSTTKAVVQAEMIKME